MALVEKYILTTLDLEDHQRYIIYPERQSLQYLSRNFPKNCHPATGCGEKVRVFANVNSFIL